MRMLQARQQYITLPTYAGRLFCYLLFLHIIFRLNILFI